MPQIFNNSWTEISQQVILDNCRLCSDGRTVMAVVKANAYGHGDVQIAGLLQHNLGISNFAVSCLSEAMNLRSGGIRGQILILGYTPINSLGIVKEFDITHTLLDEDYARRAAETGCRIKAQFAIDTGMNRIGLDADRPDSCESVIRKYASVFQLTGIFTHLCVADSPDDGSSREFTEMQTGRFLTVAERVRDLNLPYVHCLNSAGTLWHDAPGTTLSRLGIVLYGLKPDASNTLPEGVRPALEWKSVISLIKTVQPGETIGYGRTYRAESPRRIATLPVGYADGYSRMLSNRGKVLIHGRAAPIVGRICMDQMTVDVTEIPEAAPEEIVVLLGRSGELKYDADDMAQDIGTIGYEVVSAIAPRVPRTYH